MVKSRDEATRDLVLESGVIHFDKKPVVLWPWTTDIDSLKSVKSVPVWIRVPDLGLQYWGVNCLNALVSTIGKPIRIDKITKDRSLIKFARVLVDMEIAKSLPQYINYLNERGQVLEQPVEYEWLPTKCSNFGIGALLSTKIKGEKIKDVMSSTFVGWDYYSSLRLEGIILLIWKASLVRIEAVQESDQFLHCRVRICNSKHDFCLTIVYGSNLLEARRILWYDLAHLLFPIKPWVLLGDSNAVFDPNVRMGGRPISVKELEDARKWLDLGLVEELKVIGSYYTWSNNQEGGNRIYAKLDRVFSNEDWLDYFPSVTVVSHWEAKSNLYNDPNNSCLNAAEREAFLEISKQEKLYASFLSQKSKIDWLRFGDENSSFFHASLKKRKVANRIVSFISGEASGSIDPHTIALGPVLDLDAQLELIKLFSSQEVKAALFSIQPIKSPGPDGYGAGFFKALWKHIGKEVSQAVLDFFYSRYIPKFLNNTIIALIPKVDHPGAFIKHRSFAYNVLILQDLIKGYNRKNSSPRCMMKIDISKAYDSIDWDFLENLLKALCFPSHFIRWIMVCLRASKEKDFKFHPLCKSLSLISLSFADDLLLFCKANTASVQIIQRAFEGFSSSLGLIINNHKSRIYFGGVSTTVKASILEISQLVEGFFPLTYLGVSLRPTKWKAIDCDIILKKIRLRLRVWASRHLSYAGRVQLVHSVLMGIHNYWMSIFLLPQGVIRDIDRLCRNFLWGEKGSRRKLHLTSWEQIYHVASYKPEAAHNGSSSPIPCLNCPKKKHEPELLSLHVLQTEEANLYHYLQLRGIIPASPSPVENLLVPASKFV
ncbi:uncharacterized protein LOC133792381 [Humulus lupulus]|uniref:uncharacterized protein LOC133792381 n=1 Tax=Humulus lupulus TaxID=3486 RepID=UPI002B404C9E|nr:uncharacterized protein LOC133792381 [Humulus lupulus]